MSYPVSLGDDARGNITRLDNAIDNFTDRIADAENALQNLEQQKQAAEVEVAKPFAQEEELAEKSARLSELNALLNIDRSSAQDSPEKTEETPTTLERLDWFRLVDLFLQRSQHGRTSCGSFFCFFGRILCRTAINVQQGVQELSG